MVVKKFDVLPVGKKAPHFLCGDDRIASLRQRGLFVSDLDQKNLVLKFQAARIFSFLVASFCPQLICNLFEQF